MSDHKFTYLETALFAGILVLLSTTTAKAVTPACGSNLTTNTTFDSDLVCNGDSVALSIRSDNVTLDCAGYSVTTSGRGAAGISASNVSGITIENCNIHTSGTTGIGINLQNASGSEIANNTIATSNSYAQGIRLIRSSGNIIGGNNISTTGISARAILIENQSSNNVVSGNSVSSALSYGVRIRAGSDFNTLSQNSIDSGSSYAVAIESSSNNNLTGNTFMSPFSFILIRNLTISNGGLSVDDAGNIYAVENNFGGSGGSGGAVTTLIQVDPNTGDPSSYLRLVSGGNDLGFGFDSLEIMSDGRFLATRGGNNTSLYEINPSSGEVALISITFPTLAGNLNGLQSTGVDTLLATTNQGELLSIDLSTNVATLIGQDGDGWSDLAMHPTSGRLYTTSRWSLEPSGTTHLYEIDPATGAIIQEIGDIGDAFIGDIDFSTSGVLYGNNWLYTIDTTSGAGTYIGPFGPDPHEPPSQNNTLSDQIFTATTEASVEFLEPILLPPSLELSLDASAIQIGFNSIFIDSANFPFLDVPARITFENLGGTGRILQVDYEDDGTFETCDPPQCTFVSFVGGTLIFDVTGFTTYSSAEALVINVEIDIKPGSDTNCFNNNGRGVIPVAILSSIDLDATQIDPLTVSLDGQAVRIVGKKGNVQSHTEDVNADGFTDLVLQITDEDGTYSEGDAIAILTGETIDGTSIQGTDAICIVP